MITDTFRGSRAHQVAAQKQQGPVPLCLRASAQSRRLAAARGRERQRSRRSHSAGIVPIMCFWRSIPTTSPLAIGG